MTRALEWLKRCLEAGTVSTGKMNQMACGPPRGWIVFHPMKACACIFALAASGILAGCNTGDGRIVVGRSDSVRFKLPPEISTAAHPPVTPYEIEVIDISDASRPFVVVGLAEAETATLHDAVDRLRQEASKIGGDAILDIVPTPGGNATMGVPLLGDLSFRSGRIWTARVIRWLPPGAIIKNAAGAK